MSHVFMRKVGPAIAIAMLLAMVLPWVAVADDVSNTIDTSIDTTLEIMPLKAGGASGTTQLFVQPRNGDGKNGCNLTGTTTLKVGVHAVNPAIATVSPSTITFSACEEGYTLTVTPLRAGETPIVLSPISNDTGASFNLAPATFIVSVTSDDTSGPVITPIVSGQEGQNGWYTGDVTVDWTVVDNESTITSQSGCQQTIVSTETTGQQLTCTATSTGGTSSASVTIKLDKTGPTNVGLSPNAAPTGQNGWYTSDVTVATVGGDTISSPVTCTSPQVQSTETASTQINGSCTNQAGLTTTATPLLVKLDKSAPTDVVLAVIDGTLGENGWYTSDVTIGTTGSDSISGPVTCTTNQQQIAESTGQSFNGSCVNAAGLRANANSLTVKLDKTGPVNPELSVVSGTVGLNGWYVSDVTVQTSASEDISNPIACTQDQYLTADTTSSGQTFNGDCTNDAGLIAQADALTVLRDVTPPTVTATATVNGQPYGGNWTNGDVVVHFACEDPQPGSGIAGVCPDDITVDHSTGSDGRIISASVSDHAGNQSMSNDVMILVDKDFPTITASATTADGEPYTGGWTGQAVTVSFRCSDQGGSGLSTLCPDPIVVDADTAAAGQDVSASVADLAGNQTTSNVINVRVDMTAPVITDLGPGAQPNGQNGWYTIPVTVTFGAQDAGSGFTGEANPYIFLRSTDTAEGSAVVVATGPVTDAVGNTNPGIQSAAFKIDLSDPDGVTAVADRQPDRNGWYNTPVSFDFTGMDDVSGIDSCSEDVSYDAPDGSGMVVAGSCTDYAGRSSGLVDSPAFNYDATAPTNVTGGPDRAPDSSGWYNAPVTIVFTGTDATSGVDTCTTTTYAGPDGLDLTVPGSCMDIAGNTSPTVASTAFQYDATAPSNIVFNGGPADGGVYYYGTVPATPTCSADDAMSGLQSCSVSGYATTVGAHTLTATAQDTAGNQALRSVSYTVLAWTLNGFYQPVDMGSVLNTVKSGSTVPLKFEVFAGATELTDTSVVKSLTYRSITTPSGVATDEIELVATGGTVLRYDAIAGQFIYNWQTPKNSAGKSFKVTITFQDGSSISADFKLK